VDAVVLLAEAEPELARLYRSVLERAGYTVLEADTGAEALSLLSKVAASGQAPSMIVLDLVLPEVDGLAVLRTLAEQEYPYPTVAISTDRDRLEAAHVLGAQATLAMPFPLAELAAAVAKHVSRDQRGSEPRRSVSGKGSMSAN
jgi:DNA-binding response OmpR family regulator